MAGPGTSELHFEPPGPGSWGLDPVHFPRPVTRYWTEMHPEPFRRGTHEFMAFYGTPLDALETQYVNGFAYNTMRPAPDEEIPQRFARAEEVWERKVWREQLREWDETFKPAAIKPTVSIADLDKLDIRVGSIEFVEDVPASEKLVRMRVDFGDHKRTILVGMKKERPDAKSEVEGKQALFVVNLPARKMAGEISEGMMFDIGYSDAGLPVLAVPEKPIPNGCRAG